MKKILLIACGSVAISKVPSLVDLLKDYDLKIIATDFAKDNFPEINKLNIEQENTSLETSDEARHIFLAKWADLICVVPASANTISKFANGICDNFALTTMLAHDKPMLFVPAMNHVMWKNLEKMLVIDKITSLNHMLLGPTIGKLHNGEINVGRMVEPTEIKNTIDNILTKTHAKTVLIASGASKVFIDPIRFISNSSSGIMGKLLANELRLKGLNVILKEINFDSNADYANQVIKMDFDYFISPAAFADFNVNPSANKIKKLSISKIDLLDNLDVISFVKQHKPNAKYIAFKHDNSRENAVKKLVSLDADMIIWNKIGSMGNNNIEGEIIYKNGEFKKFSCSKLELAIMIAEVI